MKNLLAGLLLIGFVPHSALAENWFVDPTHVDIVARWNHAGFSMQTLKFHEVEGNLTFEPGAPEAAHADFAILADSLDTGFPPLDAELRGTAFFDVATHPTIRFVSTSVEQTGEMTLVADGDLTMRGVTLPVRFDILVHDLGPHPVGEFFDYFAGDWLGMTATTTINRSEWGLDHLIPIGSDRVNITINVELKAGGFDN